MKEIVSDYPAECFWIYWIPANLSQPSLLHLPFLASLPSLAHIILFLSFLLFHPLASPPLPLFTLFSFSLPSFSSSPSPYSLLSSPPSESPPPPTRSPFFTHKHSFSEQNIFLFSGSAMDKSIDWILGCSNIILRGGCLRGGGGVH